MSGQWSGPETFLLCQQAVKFKNDSNENGKRFISDCWGEQIFLVRTLVRIFVRTLYVVSTYARPDKSLKTVKRLHSNHNNPNNLVLLLRLKQTLFSTVE